MGRDGKESFDAPDRLKLEPLDSQSISEDWQAKLRLTANLVDSGIEKLGALCESGPGDHDF
jgi:hypothetical protein